MEQPSSAHVVDRRRLESDPTLAEIVRRVRDVLHPDRIYLFGSQARGEAGPDSDYDLFVVVEHASEPGYRLSQRAHSTLWGLKASVDILVWTREAFEARSHLRAALPATVLREGKLLYAA
jgi:predicted nucleotidyltransferase